MGWAGGQEDLRIGGHPEEGELGSDREAEARPTGPLRGGSMCNKRVLSPWSRRGNLGASSEGVTVKSRAPLTLPSHLPLLGTHPTSRLRLCYP